MSNLYDGGRVTMRFMRIALIIITVTVPSMVYANNITVSNCLAGNQDPVADTMEIQFDISWENSWRNSTNYDAAWVFFMISTDGGISWKHGTLKANDTDPLDDGLGWSKGSGTDIEIAVPVNSPAKEGDKKGAFIQRSSSGSGALSATGVTFVWDYGADGIADSQASHPINTTIRVMAIEMVYIPTGPYYLGDGNGSTESTYAFHTSDNTKVGPIGTSLIQDIKVDANAYDDDQIEVSGIGINGNEGIDTSNDGAIDNVDFPTGYKAFYVMKYEISQGQYTDFLNTISATQASKCFPNKNGYQRHTISVSGGTYSCTAPNRACNYISWTDLCAYADWAALRPMTELEFEKICRGTENAIVGEYAWGNTSIYNAQYTIMNDGQPNATIQNQPIGVGNAAYITTTQHLDGPLRCGIFAQAGTTREEAGASFYGVMDMSGGLWERAVTVGNAAGRSFLGSHGDGNLSTDGYATNSDWPGYASGKVSGTGGSGLRGGSWWHPLSQILVSDRSIAAQSNSARDGAFGGRCVRTAP